MIATDHLRQLAEQCEEYHAPVAPDGALPPVVFYDVKRLTRKLGRQLPDDINKRCQLIVTKATQTGWMNYGQAQKIAMMLAPYTQENVIMNLLRDTKLFPYMNGALLLMVTPAGTMTATIRDVTFEKPVQGDEPIVAVRFNEFSQAVSLNKTRALQLMDELGFNTDNWRGAKVRLTADKKPSTAFGKKYHALSVQVLQPPKSAEKPAPAPQAELFADDAPANGAYED